MLATLLELYDHHPSEDTTTTALLVQGVLKAAAVLKVVRLKCFPSPNVSLLFRMCICVECYSTTCLYQSKL